MKKLTIFGISIFANRAATVPETPRNTEISFDKKDFPEIAEAVMEIPEDRGLGEYAKV